MEKKRKTMVDLENIINRNSYNLFIWYSDESKIKDIVEFIEEEFDLITITRIDLNSMDDNDTLLFDYYVQQNKFNGVFYTLFLNANVIYNDSILDKKTILDLVENNFI
jgi:glycerol-3-phosphate responsive antiterminator